MTTDHPDEKLFLPH